MDGAAAASSFGVLLQILLLDLLLSGDNALVIALACRRLTPEQAHKAAWLGAAGAILLRLILTLMVGALMRLPFLQLASALPLLVIALNLMQGEDEDGHLSAGAAQGGMIAAAGVIIVADAAMSVDNVVALAAVSGGNFWLLAFGLACSIPMIVFGSFGFGRLMQAFPLLADFGAGLLGWVAGGMMVNDPALADWVRIQAPALGFVTPLACAIFVLVQGRFAREAKNAAPGAVFAAAPVVKVAPKAAPVAAAPHVRMPPPEKKAVKPSAPSVAKPEESTVASDDRWMFVGLGALFVIFGAFLTVVLMIPD